MTLVIFLVLPLIQCGDVRVAMPTEHVAPTPHKQPNLLLIVADDLGFNDLAINNNNSRIHTPNMDEIAREGMRFTRHYAGQVCSPARAALLTGLFPVRLGYAPNAPGISADVITLPEHLQAAGYTTWHLGKWHLGDRQRSAWPDRQGFDHWFGFLNQWRLAGFQSGGNVALRKPRYMNPYLEGDRDPGRNVSGHLENILTDKAIAVLDELRVSENPWFLNLWFYAPHAPIEPAVEFAQQYPDTDAGRYRALVHQLDHNIGRVLKHLDTLELAKDTLVVIVSDNGGTSKHIDSNTPYHGRKSTFTEGGLRTPFIVRWTNASLNRRIVDDIVTIEDLYPTLAEALGLAAPVNVDGRSYYASLLDEKPIATRNLFWAHGSNSRSYGALSADGNWRLYQPEPYYNAVVAPSLYDLTLDPTSHTSVDNPVQMRELQEAFASWYADVQTVPTIYVAVSNGQGALSGRDLQRTPGFGSYTFGMEFPANYAGQLAYQSTVWGLHSDGEKITATFGELVLTGIVDPERQCHSVVVTGLFRYLSAAFGPKASTSLTLYVDGVEAEKLKRNSELTVLDPSSPTMIGDPAATPAPVLLAAPVILTAELNNSTPVSLAEFTQQFCREERSQAAAL